MARANCQITLRGGRPEGGWLRFEPGETIEGTAQIVPESDIRANHVWLRLQWHTEGRGDRDEGRVAALDVFQGVLRARTPVTYNFNFTLPREPWSYTGHYLTIIWEIVVQVDIPFSSDIRQGQRFILAPAPSRTPAAAWPGGTP